VLQCIDPTFDHAGRTEGRGREMDHGRCGLGDAVGAAARNIEPTSATRNQR
jgi:hypothetical protein